MATVQQILMGARNQRDVAESLTMSEENVALSEVGRRALQNARPDRRRPVTVAVAFHWL